MSPAERLKLLLFLAPFFGAVGFLCTLLSCGTEYWLLAAETCSGPEGNHGGSGLRESRGEVFTLNTAGKTSVCEAAFKQREQPKKCHGTKKQRGK